MHTNTEFYDLPNKAVIGWQAAVKRACDRQPTSHPENLTAETICRLTGLLPLYPFTVPDGMVATGPMTIEIVDGAAYKRYDTVTIEAHEAQRAAYEAAQAIQREQDKEAAFAQQAWGLPQDLVDAYAAFMAAFEQAVVAAMMAGAEINPTSVTFQNLIGALNQLEGEQWLKIANTLTGLWGVVVVHTGKTPGEAYMMQPMLEWRRLNPPPETGVDE